MREGFRLVISIYRGTCAGRALELMANGIGVEYDTIEKVAVAVDRYLDAASAVLSGVSPGISLGVVVVVNLKEGIVVRTEVLKS